MRNLVRLLTTFIYRLALVMSLLVSIYAIANLARLIIISQEQLPAPDTGFLIAILLTFGSAAIVIFLVGSAVLKRPSTGLGLRLLVIAAVYSLMILLFANSDLGLPFYGLVPTLGAFLFIMAFQVLGLLALSILCFLQPYPPTADSNQTPRATDPHEGEP